MSEFRNKEFWDKKLASGDFKIPQRAQDWDRRGNNAADAWSAQIDRDSVGGPVRPQQQHDDPRKQFEQNVLKQAQGFWNMLQGKGNAPTSPTAHKHWTQLCETKPALQNFHINNSIEGCMHSVNRKQD